MKCREKVTWWRVFKLEAPPAAAADWWLQGEGFPPQHTHCRITTGRESVCRVSDVQTLRCFYSRCVLRFSTLKVIIELLHYR